MKRHLSRLVLWGIFGYLLVKSCLGFEEIASGTGTAWGAYSIKWGLGYLIFVLICVSLFVLLGAVLWRREKLDATFEKSIQFRERLGNARWLLVAILFIVPIWYFQYTPWGVVFKDIYIRSLVWLIVVLLLTFLLKRGNAVFGWPELLIALLITSSGFVIAVPFMSVTDYPFALGWSEGNRLWDYSIMFGRNVYDYPAGASIPVLLDTGRQLVGGLPFLLKGLSIEAERFWIALTVVLPYFLLGLAAFRFVRADWKAWLLASLWVVIFLKQGPIHPPLVLIAAIVALAWRGSYWCAIPLMIAAGYFAQTGRFTWAFAPAMWIVMLEFVSASFSDRKTGSVIWTRSISLGLAGLVGAFVLSSVISIPHNDVQASDPITEANTVPLVTTPTATQAVQVPTANPSSIPEQPSAPTFIDSIIEAVTIQPLLWYRLLPNATYGIGILAGLLIATLSLIAVLIYLFASNIWTLNRLQALVVIGALFAFLVVGLIASTKIGGGGDLHNMDMFLIGLVFTAVIAWHRGGREWLGNINLSPLWIKLVLVLLFAIPGFQPLTAMRSYSFDEDLPWLRVLTDAAPKSTLDMLPSHQVTDEALEAIRSEVARVRSQGGEVLFMDQRQLLTFGYVRDVPLIPEYEKKMLMNEALSANSTYFKPFYADLAAQRFALIITDPLRTPIKDSSYQFGEENNAWVTWVSNPVLCYYEEKDTLKEVNVQLLVPKHDAVDCSGQLPRELQP